MSGHVVGFLFDTDRTEVVLARIGGILDAVGGPVDEGRTVREAMNHHWREKGGTSQPWAYAARLTLPLGLTVHVMSALVPLGRVETQRGPNLERHRIDRLLEPGPGLDHVGNEARWLVPFAAWGPNGVHVLPIP